MAQPDGTPTPDTDQSPDFKASFHVLIVGAGLVGLGTAILLRKAGYKVTVLERDTELRESSHVSNLTPFHNHNQIGAGVQLPANHNKVLQEMGLLETITAQSIIPPSIRLHSYSTGALLTTLPLHPSIPTTYGTPHLVIHRADLRQTLYTHALSLNTTIHLGTKIDPHNSTTSLPTATVTLPSGEALTGDLLIGADGESSTCRASLLNRPSPPRPIGRLSNRIVIPASACPDRSLIDPPDIHTWLGPGCQALCYLMHGALNIVMNRPMHPDEEFFPGPRPVDIEELRQVFEGWDPRIRALLELAEVGGMMKWVSVETEVIGEWVHERGKFVLVGDAAHATLPYLGQGAAIGLESACVLSRLLAHATSPEEVPPLLRLYNDLRRDRVQHVIRASRKMGDIWHMANGPLQEERDRVLREEEPTAGWPNMLADPFFQRKNETELQGKRRKNPSL
ncbi:MAG: hypothetical protein Q9195_007815 [Heterodermia aff. obscurata]